jgi:hypothetical protein
MMKRFTIAIMLMVVIFGLTFVFYAKSGEVPAQKEGWNHAGSGFELTGLRTTNSAPTQTEVWNRAGSGFELSSLRTITEIKVTIQKYWWNSANSGFELTSQQTTSSASEQE